MIVSAVVIGLSLGLAAWGGVAGAIGVNSALWLAFGLLTAAALALIAVPDIRRLPPAPPWRSPPHR